MNIWQNLKNTRFMAAWLCAVTSSLIAAPFSKHLLSADITRSASQALEAHEWIEAVKLTDEAVMAKVREVAWRLLSTTFQTISLLEVTPYIDGTPAGESLMPNPNRQTEITKKIPAPSPWSASLAELNS